MFVPITHEMAKIEMRNNCKKRLGIKLKTINFFRAANIPPEKNKNRTTVELCMIKHTISNIAKNEVSKPDFDFKKRNALKNTKHVKISGINWIDNQGKGVNR